MILGAKRLQALPLLARFPLGVKANEDAGDELRESYRSLPCRCG